MRRREFLGACGAGTLARVVARPEPNPSTLKPVLMKLGCQSGPTTDERLQFFKRHGVEHICGWPDNWEKLRYYSVEDLSRLRERCERHGIKLEMVQLPLLTSTHIDHQARPAILLGQSPERDRDIDDIIRTLESCAKVGVPIVKYNLSILGVLRTGYSPGRGGSRYSTWKLAEAKPGKPLTRAGVVDADLFWERITYFLERVIPVATELKVRMACHPHDPGVPAEGYQGVVRVLGTVEGLKRLVSIQESPYHGLNFCQGTVAEMLENPATEIYEVIRWFGERKKIFNVHFRNIRGRRDDFMEVYPDEGDVDMVRCAMIYRDVGYDGMLMPDHVPFHPHDPDRSQAFAFAYGYIRGILQSLQYLPSA